MVWERRFGSRPNGVLLVFGQTAMYAGHRIVLERPHLHGFGFGDLGTTCLISALLLLVHIQFACIEDSSSATAEQLGRRICRRGIGTLLVK